VRKNAVEADEAISQYESMIRGLLSSYPDVVAEFEQCIAGRNYRGAYVLVEKTMRADGISFSREQDRTSERFFFYSSINLQSVRHAGFLKGHEFSRAV
jgi:hypothetical protein